MSKNFLLRNRNSCGANISPINPSSLTEFEPGIHSYESLFRTGASFTISDHDHPVAKMNKAPLALQTGDGNKMLIDMQLKEFDPHEYTNKMFCNIILVF